MTQAAAFETVQGFDRPVFRRAPHVLAGITLGLVSPFAGIAATVFALLTGFVLAGDERDRHTAKRRSGLSKITRIVAVSAGVVGIVLAGGVVGLVVGLLIVPLVTRSERAVIDAAHKDRVSSRVLLLVLATLVSLTLQIAVAGLRLG